ncbi:hypothetical protein GCM10027586_12070 [Kineococcus gypseus]
MLAQVQFPPLSALIADDRVAGEFAAVVRSSYPIMVPQQESTFLIGPQGVQEQPLTTRSWQLRSADESWGVHVGSSFLSLDTGAYVSRSDFLSRWDAVWSAFVGLADPPVTTRVGIRYINQVADEALLEHLDALLEPPVLGMVGVPLDGAERLHALGQAQFRVEESRFLTVRSGLVPAGLVLDPSVPPSDRPCWVLDLDAFEETRGDAAPPRVREVLATSAALAHAFFRWSTTDRFIETFGGGAS